MNLDKLYKMQEELDNHILENRVKRIGKEIDRELLLEHTILALLVEVGELANTTRCFKHWSTKGKMKDEIILEELADVWHFYLSIGNQINCKLSKKYFVSEKDYNFIIGNESTTEIILISLFQELSTLGCIQSIGMNIEKQKLFYKKAGGSIFILGRFLGFTNEEVEQAYLKKYKENYRRQEVME